VGVLTEIATNPIHLATLPALFTSDGLEVQSPAQLLQQLGISKITELVSSLRPLPGDVQKAPTGVIQDPAGVAIGFNGSPKDSGAGAASIAIYQQFPDLQPIPSIKPRSAIFNSSTGPGHRVLHTYSPELAGSPGTSSARQQVIEDLANAYANALGAFRERAPDLGADGTLLNLIPVSAGDFANQFKLGKPYFHLHPSYTICAIALALNWWRSSSSALPPLTLYFHEQPVYKLATDVMDGLAAAAGAAH
jgi:hypothetical protein